MRRGGNRKRRTEIDRGETEESRETERDRVKVMVKNEGERRIIRGKGMRQERQRTRKRRMKQLRNDKKGGTDKGWCVCEVVRA